MKKLILVAMFAMAAVLAGTLAMAQDEAKADDTVTVKGVVTIVEGAVTIKTEDGVTKVALDDEGKRLLSRHGKTVEATGKMVNDELKIKECKAVAAEEKAPVEKAPEVKAPEDKTE